MAIKEMFTNDTFQGREKAKFVPLSDQWGDPPKKVKVPKDSVPANYHKKNVMKDSNGKGVATEIVEDIFHSFEAFGKHPNPHNARYMAGQGKYYFDYPASWLNSNTVARAIALRSITVRPPALAFAIGLTFILPGDDLEVAATIHISVPSAYTTDQALSAICKTVNKVSPAGFPSNLCYAWNLMTNTASLFLLDKDGSVPTGGLMINHVTDGFKWLLNIRDSELPHYLARHDSWDFAEVWDRRSIFVHASFVNNAAFHYLGTDGEFYTSPSKIYYQNFTGNDFEVYLTTDGVTPIDLPYQDFSIELSLLIDRNHFQE
jgi:hypothetical protein